MEIQDMVVRGTWREVADAARTTIGRDNLLIIVVLLLPFSLTLSLAWSCKDAVLRQLSNLDHSRDFGADRP